MKRYVVLALVVGFLVGAEDPKKDKGKKDATVLEGTWVVISVMADGKERDEGKDAQLVFKGKTVTHKTKDNEEKGTFTADPKKKTFDLTPSDGPKKGMTLKGIYQLKGDELKMCFQPQGKDRPKDFNAQKGSGNVLIVLERAKDKGDKKEKVLAQVEGKVLLGGQPLAKANVVFVPVDKKGQKAMGTTHEDGTFELTTGGNKKDVHPGVYKVLVTKKVAGKSVLRAEYGSEKTTPLNFTVYKGRNQFDIQLK